MAKWLDDKSGLLNWKASMAMVGMAKSRPIQARMAALVARTENDAYRENKTALKDLVESATQIAQAQGRADLGTAMHEFTELMDAGTLDWAYVPEALKGPLDAYAETSKKYRTLDSEVFISVDKGSIRGAGSLDRLIEHDEYGVVVADIKTGTDEPRYPLGCTTQVAIYARGLRYRDARFPGAPEFLDGTPNKDGTAWRKPLHPDINESDGILIHLPLEKVDGKYRCDLYHLNLEKGWDSLLLGHKVQTARRPPKLKKLT